MNNPVVQEILEKQVLTVAKVMEDKIDEEISALDRLDPDDMEALRERRLQQMKKMAKRSRWISLGHGDYSEIFNENEFFSIVKASERVVCHFYRENWPCKITRAKKLMLEDPEHPKEFKFDHVWPIMKDFVKYDCTSQRSRLQKISSQSQEVHEESLVSLDRLSSFSLNLSDESCTGSGALHRPEDVKKIKIEEEKR